jgi:hypothetical protein
MYFEVYQLSLPSDSTTKILYTFLISSKRAIKTTYFIAIIISNDTYQSRSFSLRTLPQPAVNFSFLFEVGFEGITHVKIRTAMLWVMTVS